jgi:plastocyanin
MSKSGFTFIAIALVIVVVVIFASLSNKNSTPSANTQSETSQSTEPDNSIDALDSDSDASSEEATVTTVRYTDDGYSPKSVEVAVGSTVMFINDSTQAMWTASDPHPVHTNLSAFDA